MSDFNPVVLSESVDPPTVESVTLEDVPNNFVDKVFVSVADCNSAYTV